MLEVLTAALGPTVFRDGHRSCPHTCLPPTAAGAHPGCPAAAPLKCSGKGFSEVPCVPAWTPPEGF
jgi:hypothetical protein